MMVRITIKIIIFPDNVHVLVAEYDNQWEVYCWNCRDLFNQRKYFNSQFG